MITINNVLTGSGSMTTVKKMAEKIDFKMLIFSEENNEVVFCHHGYGEEEKEKACALISFIFNEHKQKHIEIKFFDFFSNNLYLSKFRVLGTKNNTLDLILRDEDEMRKMREVAKPGTDIQVKMINNAEHVLIRMWCIGNISFH